MLDLVQRREPKSPLLEQDAQIGWNRGPKCNPLLYLERVEDRLDIILIGLELAKTFHRVGN